MKIDLNTLFAAITIIFICSVLNTEEAAGATYNWPYYQQPHQHYQQHQHHQHHRHHQHYQQVVPYGYVKGYDGLASANSIQQGFKYTPTAYQLPYSQVYPQHHHHHHNHQQQQQLLNYPQLAQPSFYDPNHEDHLLKESAKDPRNLKNGILHNGAITYDLGMPRYEILNGHEAPEIITSDQPHYQEHLRQLQQTQNFTLEDFDITTDAPQPTEATTPNLRREQERQNAETSTPHPDIGLMDLKDSNNIQRSVSKELDTAKDKIEKINEEIKEKYEKTPKGQKSDKDVNFYVMRKSENVSKKMRPSPFKTQAAKAKKEERKQSKMLKDKEAEAEKIGAPTKSNDAPQNEAEQPNESKTQDTITDQNVSMPQNGSEQPNQSTITDQNMFLPNAQQNGAEHSNQSSAQDTIKDQNLFLPSHQAPLPPAMQETQQFVQSPILTDIHASIPAVPVQYQQSALPVEYSYPYQTVPLNSVPSSHLPMSAGNIQQLYREVSFLESGKKS